MGVVNGYSSRVIGAASIAENGSSGPILCKIGQARIRQSGSTAVGNREPAAPNL